MGYTHYWTQKRKVPVKVWATIIADVGEIVARSNVRLAYEYDEPERKPVLDADQIRFNGVDDDGHETFQITREIDGDGWTFCKTAQKPYDTVVTAILAYLCSTYPAIYTASSDGDAEDWKPGVDLAKEALPHRAIAVPSFA